MPTIAMSFLPLNRSMEQKVAGALLGQGGKQDSIFSWLRKLPYSYSRNSSRSRSPPRTILPR